MPPREHNALQLCAASPAAIPLIQSLARRIWNHCYPAIISQEQIDYMLDWMYAADRLEGEMTEGGVFFFLLRHDDRDVGFAALGTGEGADELHLHKLYLLPECQGRGLGSLALSLLKEFAQSRGARRLSLRVNRHNRTAVRCYQRNGFRIERQVLSKIGAGFVMDDHWMEASLRADCEPS